MYIYFIIFCNILSILCLYRYKLYDILFSNLIQEYLQNTQCNQSSVQGSEPNSDGELSTDSEPSSPPVIWRHGSMSSLYGTDIGEENRQLVKSLAEHITYSKSRTVGKPLILQIRFFPCASIFRYVRESIKVMKNCNCLYLTQSCI